jgi:hypothetical protein
LWNTTKVTGSKRSPDVRVSLRFYFTFDYEYYSVTAPSSDKIIYIGLHGNPVAAAAGGHGEGERG